MQNIPFLKESGDNVLAILNPFIWMSYGLGEVTLVLKLLLDEDTKTEILPFFFMGNDMFPSQITPCSYANPR